MDNPLVSVIVLNFNGLRFLDPCLRTVLNQGYSPFEVLLVDNDSRDGSPAYVEKHFPGVRLIHSGANLGFAGGNNLGVARAKGELIVLLNNDTTVEEGWLQGLVEAVSRENVAIASSFVLTEGIPARYYERNGSVNLVGHNIMRVFSRPEEILYAGGTSMIFRKSIVDVPFEDLYFAYSEDLYCSLRARFKGYQVVQAPSSVVRHVGSGTARTTASSTLTMLRERNRLLTIVLFFDRWTLIRIIPFFAGNMLAKVMIAVLSGRYSLPGLIRAYLWFPINVRWIIGKRRGLRRERICQEQEILSLMSARLTNGESAAGRLINRMSLFYCRMTGLRTIEIERGNAG
ncbi:MAG: glycosyltransferase family 2 protein [Ignavibacteria bacterium]|nr:glycosyltransferase family 2 protein [Ignavibacteria bacterium]